MSGYWVVTASETVDQEAYAEYVRLWGPIAQKYGAKMIAARTRHQNKEGQGADRVTLVEFPSYEDAIACYDDPAYQAAMPYVHKAGTRNLMIVEGV